MSSLLPVQPAPAATRRADPVAPERRSTEGADRFADSLASARAADLPDANSHDYAAAKDRLASQQRTAQAQVRALMLNGAMRFAAAKRDDTGASSPTCEPHADAAAETDDELAVADLLAGQLTLSSLPAAVVIGVAPGDLPTFAVAAGLVAPPADDVVPTADAALLDGPVEATTADVAGAAMPSMAAATLAMLTQLPLPQAQASDEVPSSGEIAEPLTGRHDSRGDPLLHTEADTTPDARTAALAQLRAELETASYPGIMRTSALLEDHFDVPAVTVADILPLTNAIIGAVDGVRLSQIELMVQDDSAGDAELRAAIAATRSAPAPASGAPKSTTAVVRDMDALEPEFRQKLETVIERMRAEFGREVTVVETARTQARQDALYAQGRTTPGPVVTWTRNSRHLTGRAADLMVDGTWDNPAGYADLATVAAAEGLRTLGSRDAGHVELPGGRPVAAETIASVLGDLEGEAGDGARLASGKQAKAMRRVEEATGSTGLAQVASVAQVARVATVAQVARVAEVARPGISSRRESPADGGMPAVAASAVPPAGSAHDASAMAARVISAPTPVNMADRISQLMDLQATQAARPLNSVLLRMDNANGIQDQIRIDTRGTSVDARLGLGNAQQAAALTDRIGELRDALERRGLTADGVRVQAASAPRATDSVAFSRPVAPVLEMAAMRASSDSQAQGNTRDQSGRDQQQREALAREQSRPSPRSSSDDARNRSRREHPEARR